MKPDPLSDNQASGHPQTDTWLLNDRTTLLKAVAHQKLNSSLNPLKQQKDKLSRQPGIACGEQNNNRMDGDIINPKIREWLSTEEDSIAMQIAKYLSTAKEDNGMTLTGLQQLAKAIGVFRTGNITSESALIRLIQKVSHHKPCYRAKPNELCIDTAPCQWRNECQKLVAEWQR